VTAARLRPDSSLAETGAMARGVCVIDKTIVGAPDRPRCPL